MHSSRMHTAHLLTISHSARGCLPNPPPECRHPQIYAPPPLTEWQTDVKTLPCPKLRLQVVMNIVKNLLHIHNATQQGYTA